MAKTNYEGNMKKEDLERLIINAHDASIITEEETTVLKEALKDMVDADALQLGEELEDALMADQALNDEVITLAAMLCTVSETPFTERQMFQAAKRARLAELNHIVLTGVEVYKTVKKPRKLNAISKLMISKGTFSKANTEEEYFLKNTITAYHPVLRIEFNGTAYSFSYNRLDLSLAFNEADSPLNWFNFRHELSNPDFDQTKTKQHIELIVPYIKQVLGIR